LLLYLETYLKRNLRVFNEAESLSQAPETPSTVHITICRAERDNDFHSRHFGRAFTQSRGNIRTKFITKKFHPYLVGGPKPTPGLLKEYIMPMYIALVQFTDKGIHGRQADDRLTGRYQKV
jgi:hypothetical protein